MRWGSCLLNLFIVGWLQPWTHYGYERLRFDLRSGALGGIDEGRRVQQLGRNDLAHRPQRDRGRSFTASSSQVDDRSGTQVAATASRAGSCRPTIPTSSCSGSKGRLIPGLAQVPDAADLVVRPLRSSDPAPARRQFRQRGHEELDELTLPELFRDGYLRDVPDEHKLGAAANFHFRVAEVLMMLMLPLLAVALAVPPKRSSSALGIFIGIVIVVAYHKVNQYAEQAAAQGGWSRSSRSGCRCSLPRALIYWMYHVLAHRPAGSRSAPREGLSSRARVRPQAPAQGAHGMINLHSFRRAGRASTRSSCSSRAAWPSGGAVLVLMTLDLLGESGKILAVPGNSERTCGTSVAALPLLISRFLPFSVLLGTLIAFTGSTSTARSWR
jgi:hypothetical protein